VATSGTTGSTRTQVYGVQEAIKALKEIEPKLYRQALKDVKGAAEPLRAATQSAMPGGPPLSGMDHAGRTGWNARNASRVAVKYGGRRKLDKDVWPLLGITMSGAAGSIWDMAGRGSAGITASGRALIGALPGSPSRTLWPTVEAKVGTVEGAIKKALDTVAAQTNRTLLER
jgi:hypothetical protein